MFSALWDSIRAPFNRANWHLRRSESCEVENQIFSELAAAAAKAGMVATRSQEPAPVVQLDEFPPNGIPGAETTKKRRSSELRPELHDERVSKRRAETPAKIPHPRNNGGHRVLIPTVSPSINNTNIPKDGIEVRVFNGGRSRSLLSISTTKSDGTDHGHTGQREGRNVATKPPDSPVKQKTAEKLSYPASSIENLENSDNKQLLPTSVKAKHKRFGSEEIQEEIQQDGTLPLDDDIATVDTMEPPVKVQIGIESEDEEPETITTSKGLSEARSTANEAARVAGKYVIELKTLSSH